MMKFNWRWALGALLLYVVLLIMSIPAAQVVNRVKLPANVSISGVEGSIWQGQAERVQFNNTLINDLSWDISGWSLLAGRLTAELNAGNMRDASSIAFKGPVSVSLFNPTSFSTEDFLLYLPVARVLAEVTLPIPVAAGGRFRVNVEDLDFDNSACENMMAYGDWLNASVAGTQGPIELGTFSAKISCAQQQFVVDVAEPNAFGLTMQAKAQQDMTNLSVSGQFKPDPSLPQEVHDAAKFFGRPNADGYIEFKL
ncbi:type II secretion system protein N [Alteromonas gilva]|uniref:Type II secretion system protein N n=1 Tax=Alteromonas gilva TaxID=2987522 RepID=A0ABT5KX43_9ALTE|nr:type II secretion system protein N [Alteromonas gilva]MDC8829339.1 type II secretion system protein N [Alteromonas gilva]